MFAQLLAVVEVVALLQGVGALFTAFSEPKSRGAAGRVRVDAGRQQGKNVLKAGNRCEVLRTVSLMMEKKVVLVLFLVVNRFQWCSGRASSSFKTISRSDEKNELRSGRFDAGKGLSLQGRLSATPTFANVPPPRGIELNGERIEKSVTLLTEGLALVLFDRGRGPRETHTLHVVRDVDNSRAIIRSNSMSLQSAVGTAKVNSVLGMRDGIGCVWRFFAWRVAAVSRWRDVVEWLTRLRLERRNLVKAEEEVLLPRPPSMRVAANGQVALTDLFACVPGGVASGMLPLTVPPRRFTLAEPFACVSGGVATADSAIAARSGFPLGCFAGTYASGKQTIDPMTLWETMMYVATARETATLDPFIRRISIRFPSNQGC
ncbi:hypothetical protein JOL62DRAFT_560704 [Phyllosticta paracitricarpa]|uniref:Secreted protein n=1 Tax=Phyllosticta paracitricarpa TaxID=2016321 RepID=A0ABR1MUI9_9PEZI